MNVLFTHPSLKVYGGAEKVVVKLANYLTAHNHRVTIVTDGVCDVAAGLLAEARVINTPQPHEVTRAIAPEFEVILAHNHNAQHWHIPVRTPCVWLCNEPPPVALFGGNIAPEEQRVTMDFVDRVVVADEFNCERFKSVYSGAGISKLIQVIPYGIDPAEVLNGSKEAANKKWGVSPEEFVILHVGWLNPFKNQVRSVEILSEVLKKKPYARLILAGTADEPYITKVAIMARSLDVEDRVTITGHVGMEDVRDLYARAEVIISPIGPQGGWLNVFEGILTEKPVIVAPTATCAGLVKKYGLAVVTDDFVTAILESEAKISPVNRTDAAKWVRDNLSWERCGAAWENVLREVADR